MQTLAWRLAGCLLALAFGAGSAASGKEASVTDERLSVLILTIDSFRPDHLALTPPEGAERDTTPHLRRFSREAIVFENAFATSAWTSPGMVSLLTGYLPPVHSQNGRHSWYDDTLASPLRVLAEEGWKTFGQVVRGPNYEGLGFDHRPQNRDFEAFVRERAEEGEPFVAWLMSKETHLPYVPSAAHAGRFASGRASPGIEAVGNNNLIFRPHDVDVPYRHAGVVEFVPEDAAELRALYDECVLDADAHLGRAFAALRETGLLERTIVIVSSDHGEELLEHGWVGHASTGYDGKLYDELIRVPLIVRLPGARHAGRVESLVQTTDLMPTLFTWLGVDPSRVDPPMQGASLAPALEGGAGPARSHVFAQTTRKGWTTPPAEMRQRVTAVRSRDRKLIWWPDGRIEAFDLAADPGELRNLWPAERERFAPEVDARKAFDAESETRAVALWTDGAEALADLIGDQLAAGELVAAVDLWRRLRRSQETLELEPGSSFTGGPKGERWRQQRARAGEAVGRAMACDARGLGCRASEEAGGERR